MKIIVADDHHISLFGISSFLKGRGHFVMAACSNGIEAWNKISLHKPDVAFLDQNMPGMSGIEIAQKIQAEKLNVKVVLLTMHKEKTLLDKAISSGVNGYILKDFVMDEILQCLQNIEEGKNYFSPELTKNMTIESEDQSDHGLDKLTPSEMKILKMIAQQKSSQEVAEMFFISLKTVEKHRSNIIKKLGLPPVPNSIAIWAAKNL